MLKKCRRCGKELEADLTNFRPAKGTALRAECRACYKRYANDPARRRRKLYTNRRWHRLHNPKTKL